MITIIPAIDIMDGKCVRLSEGKFETKKIYNEDPVEVAKAFEGLGLKRLHLVDLDGARTGLAKNIKVLEEIALKTSLIIDFGGGIATEDKLRLAFNAGASIINIGSIVINNKSTFLSWLKYYGTDKFLIGADVKNEWIMIKGWTVESRINIDDFIKEYLVEGVNQFFCTDISKDGMMKGPSVKLYKKILDQFPSIELVASGGVSNIKDVEELDSIGCKAVIIGKAFYEGTIKPWDILAYVD